MGAHQRHGPAEVRRGHVRRRRRQAAPGGAKAWFDGELAVPATWFEERDVEEVTQTDDGPYVTFDQLSQRGKTRMELGGAPMPMSRAQVASIEAEADLYLLLNGAGTAQTDEDMQNAARVAGRA